MTKKSNRAAVRYAAQSKKKKKKTSPAATVSEVPQRTLVDKGVGEWTGKPQAVTPQAGAAIPEAITERPVSIPIPQPAPAPVATSKYRYVVKELRTIGILAGALIVLLIVAFGVSLVLQ